MLDDVQGWLSDREADELCRMAEGHRVLEVGCWKGRSTICLAQVAGHVVSVDWFQGDAYAGRANTLPQAWQNLEAHGVRDRVSLIAGDFRVVLPLLQLGHFGLMYYDADHTYDSTSLALRLLLSGACPDTPVAVHDYDPSQPVWEGAIRATDEMAATFNRTLRVVDRLAILETLR